MQSDQWRYFDAEEVESEPHIAFCLQGLGEYGISLRDALAVNDSRLEGRDDVLCRECSPFIYIRLNVSSSTLSPKPAADPVEF